MSLKVNLDFIVVSFKGNQDNFQFLVFIKNFSLFFHIDEHFIFILHFQIYYSFVIQI
jgi:hypothetical protein